MKNIVIVLNNEFLLEFFLDYFHHKRMFVIVLNNEFFLEFFLFYCHDNGTFVIVSNKKLPKGFYLSCNLTKLMKIYFY